MLSPGTFRLTFLLPALWTSIVFAQQAGRETSDDGLTFSDVSSASSDSPPPHRGGAVPYPLTPDWQNNVRRLVSAVTAADLNGDGRADLVVGCYTAQAFPPYDDWQNLIYYNTGNQLEPVASWVSADEVHTGDIQIGDINGDRYPDIFSANGGFAFSPSVIYYGGPSGPDTTPDWTAQPPQPTWTTAATLFDFDHDNDLDVFTTTQGASPDPYRPILGFRNNSGVLQSTPFWISSQAAIQNGLDFADLDGDGWEDLAVAKWVNFETSIYKNIAGVLQTTPVWTSGFTGGDRGIAWGLIKPDTWPDLAVGRDPTVAYTNKAGTLSLTYTSMPVFETNPQELKLRDVDRDGDDDLAEIQFGGGRVNIYINDNGELSPTPSWSYDDPNSGNAVGFGDINGDTWDDLIIGTTGQPCVKVFYARIPLVLADMNCDGQVNELDIDPFVTALLDPALYAATWPFCNISRGDLNGDTFVDGLDMDGFTQSVLLP
jgi:hypothetical protein